MLFRHLRHIGVKRTAGTIRIIKNATDARIKMVKTPIKIRLSTYLTIWSFPP